MVSIIYIFESALYLMKIYNSSDFDNGETENIEKPNKTNKKITAIKAQLKNENRVSIFVENKYSFSLTLDQLLEQKLKKDREIDDARIKELKKLSDEGKLKARALEWLMNRPHSRREFRDYMFKKQAEKELMIAWEEEFAQKNYLNDENFARWFAENRLRKKKSKRAIIAELMSKGVPKQMSEHVLSDLIGDEVNDKESLRALIGKLKTRTRYQDEEKLKRYLVTKGFQYSDIKDALNSQE